jgi:hypothetical protein
MYSATKDARYRESLEFFAIPQTPHSMWTRRQPHPTPLSIAGGTGKSAARRWHISSLLLRIPGGVPPSHVQGKELLRLLIHPKMERPAILNRSMPSAEWSTMSIPAFQGCPSSSCQRFVTLSMRNAMYRFRKSIPDGDRFSQEILYQCSQLRASASV